MRWGRRPVFVCLNAYVLDYINRSELGRSASLQMLYAAAFWSAGPMLGVWLWTSWAPAPFLVAGGFALVQLAAFWVLRLGNGKQIARAKGPALNPLAYLGRFFAQPRLIAGWSFAVIRSCGWWVYVVYLPIFCIEAGLGDKVGGIALSITNALLFTTPFLLRLSTAPRCGWRCGRVPVRGGAVHGWRTAGLVCPGRRWRCCLSDPCRWCCWTWRGACRS